MKLGIAMLIGLGFLGLEGCSSTPKCWEKEDLCAQLWKHHSCKQQEGLGYFPDVFSSFEKKVRYRIDCDGTFWANDTPRFKVKEIYTRINGDKFLIIQSLDRSIECIYIEK